MKPYRVLIFDWDGTLADSTAQIVSRVQTSFREFGRTPPGEAAIRDIIGLGLHDALRRLCPDLNDAQIAEVGRVYQTDRFHHSPPDILFDRAYDVLHRLQQHYWLAVATGRSRRKLDTGLADTNTQSLFFATRTADECASKPQPDMVFSICNELGVHPREALVIGDTTHDLQMAANARSPAVSVTTGAHTPAQLQTVPHLAMLDGLASLADWLEA
ncbi:phosphoglycolate phosphatase [Eikenella longinqua]|uniref:Phosphoglycolate phosphatase n=1 Tax=Eikenella longinqua TaxID=1795827 RepID=A0A1A9S272_9NEIS|nr:HAD-IA family hydrolase [Eikenella longinqua]OAM30890.1 phosphoglycolate phosphatase [Eikenella longinqua]